METDICSKLSYDEKKRDGSIGRNQMLYLEVFKDGIALSHREATLLIKLRYGIKLPDRNGRVRELEDMGMIKKFDQHRDVKTNRLVNRWIFTGRDLPKQKVKSKVVCPNCSGSGLVIKDVYK